MRVGIDDAGDVVDQADHLLGHVIGRGRLAGKNHRTWHPVRLRIGQDLVVAADHVQQVEQLAFVFMHALDLHVKQALGVDPDAEFTPYVIGQATLVLLLGQAHRIVEGRFAGEWAQLGKLIQMATPVATDPVVNQPGQWLVRLRQPAPWRDAIGLVAEALRKKACEIGEDGLHHQLTVQGRDAVDLVAGQQAQVGHAHTPVSVLLNQ